MRIIAFDEDSEQLYFDFTVKNVSSNDIHGVEFDLIYGHPKKWRTKAFAVDRDNILEIILTQVKTNLEESFNPGCGKGIGGYIAKTLPGSQNSQLAAGLVGKRLTPSGVPRDWYNPKTNRPYSIDEVPNFEGYDHVDIRRNKSHWLGKRRKRF